MDANRSGDANPSYRPSSEVAERLRISGMAADIAVQSGIVLYRVT
jgi:hypothetical protein